MVDIHTVNIAVYGFQRCQISTKGILFSYLAFMNFQIKSRTGTVVVVIIAHNKYT